MSGKPRSHKRQKTRQKMSQDISQRPPPQSSSSDTSVQSPRAIPGFIWDPEKKRYFPATDRAPNAHKNNEIKREKKRRQDIVQKQRAHKQSDFKINDQRRRCIPEMTRVPIPRLLSLRAVRMPLYLASGNVNIKEDIESRLSLIGLKQRTGSEPLSDPRSHNKITHICSPDDTKWMIIGHKSGLLTQAVISPDDGNLVSVRSVDTRMGEITGIHKLNSEAFIWSSLGSEAQNGKIHINQTGGQTMAFFEYESSVFSATPSAPHFQPNISAGLDRGSGVVRVRDTCMQSIFNVNTKSDILSTAFLDSDKVFVAGGRDGGIRLFDIRIAPRKQNWRYGLFSFNSKCKHKSSVHSLEFSQDLVVSAAMDCTIGVWDVRMPNCWNEDLLCTNTSNKNIKLHSRSNSSYPYSSSSPGSNYVNANCSNLIGPQSCHETLPIKLGFSVIRNKIVASADPDMIVRFWSLSSGKLVHSIVLPTEDSNVNSFNYCTSICARYDGLGIPSLYIAQGDDIIIYRT